MLKPRINKKQIALALLLVGLSVWSVFAQYNLLLALCLAVLFCYMVWSFLYGGRSMFSGVGKSIKQEEFTNENYIESVRGIVSSEDFRMCTEYLVGIPEDMYENYVLKLRSSHRFKSEVESKTVNKFLGYVEEKRKERKGLEEDIRRLRYSDLKWGEKQDMQVHRAHDKLFRYTKILLWQVEPFTKKDIDSTESFYKRVKHLNGNLTLEKALERMCVLYDDHDQILKELKLLLARYHPDKNKHQKAREVYEKVDVVYRAVSTILREYEEHYGDTIFCNFKMFLKEKLENISEMRVYGEITFVYRTLEMREYLERKKLISGTRDEILTKYRELVTIVDVILEQKMRYPKNYKGSKEVKEAYKHNSEGIKKLDEQEKEVIKEIEKLRKKLKSEVEEILILCSLAKSRCERAIEEQRSVLTKDVASQYHNEKRVEKLKDMLETLSKEEKEIEVFLTRIKTKNFLSMFKALDIGGLLGGAKEKIVKPLEALKGAYRTVQNLSSTVFLETEYDYINCYSALYENYKDTIKEIDTYKVKLGEDGKHIFYKKVPVTQDGSTIPHYEEEYRDFYLNQDQLRLENNKLSKTFKTQKEIEKDYQDQLLNTKDMKEKSRQTKKEIKQLIEETEVAKDEAEKERKARKEAETKAAEAEVKVGEERAKAEGAEAKAATLASLLLQIKSGALPLSALDGIELDSVVKLSQKR